MPSRQIIQPVRLGKILIESVQRYSLHILAADSRDRENGFALLFFRQFLLVLLNKLGLQVAGYEFVTGELHDK